MNNTKTTEKENASTKNPLEGGRGRGSRGRVGGRGGGGSTAPRPRGSDRGRGEGGRTGAGGRGSNHGRHPRQPAPSPHKKPPAKPTHGGRGGGRPRASSCHDGSDDRSSKLSGPYARLFCSERHAFALSRVLYPRNHDRVLLPLNSKDGTNGHQQLDDWWEAVKIVRCHVPCDEFKPSSCLERCPICLDEDMTSPFIAPCGHIFCLACVLGYLNSVATDLNKESERLHKNKQPVRGRAGVIGSCVVSARASITSVRARCPMCSSGSSSELHAGDALITYKDLRPVAFAPTLAITAGAVGGAPRVKGNKGEHRHDADDRRGSRLKFVKLHRIPSCPAPYLPLLGHKVRGALTKSISGQCLPYLPDGDDDTEECIYARSYFAGINEFEDILQRDLNDLHNYRGETVHCQVDPREDLNVAMAIEAVRAAQRRWRGSSGAGGGFREMESDAKSAEVLGKQREHTLVAKSGVEIEDACADESKPRATSRKSASLLQPGSFYSAEPDDFLYYQSSDGQPCFLSGISVACLMHEFSLYDQTKHADHIQIEDTKQCQAASPHPPHHTKHAPRNTLPLPDEVTGTVLEVERLAVTKSLIKRKPFLSHIPLNSFVSFVEIDWYSGGEGANRPMLSHGTLSNFRGEIQRRKSERARAAKQEQKADRVARARSEKEEERRRRELRAANGCYEGHPQVIEPDDEFFRATAASAGEAREGVPQQRAAVFRFNEVCAAGGAWPELLSSPDRGHRAAAATAVPVVSAPAAASVPASPSRTATTWGSRKERPRTAAKVVVNNFPSLAKSSQPMQDPRSRGRAKSMDVPWGSKQV